MEKYFCFFIMANRHHQAARELFKQELFDLAVFHLQQSVECGYKAYILSMEFLKFQEIKPKVGHKSEKILPIISSKIISDIEIKFGQIPDPLKEHIRGHEHPIAKFANKLTNPIDLTLPQLEELIRLIEQDNSYLSMLCEKFRGKSLEFPEFVFLMNMHQYNIEESFTSLSSILGEHEQHSRYFDTQTGCPESFYSTSNPIVSKFPELCSIIEVSIKNLGLFIENFNRFKSLYST